MTFLFVFLIPLLLLLLLLIAPTAHAWTATTTTTTLPPVPPADNVVIITTTTTTPTPASTFPTMAAAASTTVLSSSPSSSSQLSWQIQEWLQDSLGVPPASAAADAIAPPPSKEDIALLRQAFASFYGMGRDYAVALDLLSKAIAAWQGQPPDEQAGLYRVRGDCQLALLQAPAAIEDYTKALELLQLDQSSNKADPAELPAA